MHAALRAALSRRSVAAVAAGLTALGATAALTVGQHAAGADTAPTAGLPATVSADALPTAQINGVAWAQVVVGNTVYVTGSFSQARPAGVKSGGAGTVTRSNLLAYDVTTGVLSTAFNHSLNGTGYAIAASPDGSTLYVGGNFTQVDGASHAYIAAFSTATNKLLTTFTGKTNASVKALAASNSAVYAGGTFSTADGTARSRLAAFSTTGGLLSWAPAANANVQTMTLAASANRVVVGGYFTSLAGATALGMGSVDAASGAAEPWAANNTIQDSGSNAAIYSLTSDANQVYGTGYFYTTGGNFEGRFAANPSTGAINWLNNCHGDSYSVAAVGSVLYGAGHEHDCSDLSSFPQDDAGPTTATHHFLFAESTTANGSTERHPIFPGGGFGPTYHDFAGQPVSTQLDWYPTLTEGSYTGQSQAAWTVAGNSSYLAVGGEFPTVNGAAQQGLARFAISSVAPNKVGPVNAATLKPVVVSRSGTSARVAWQATWDQDNTTLRYALYRGATLVNTQTVNSTFWNRPDLGYLDTGLTNGSSYTYKVVVTDPFGNAATSSTTSATISSAPQNAYAQAVLADSPAHLWPLSESTGGSSYDAAGNGDLTLTGSYARGATGPGTGTPATTFGGGETTPPTPPAQPGQHAPPPQPVPNDIASTVGTDAPASLGSFSEEAWFSTTSTAGGAILNDGLFTSKDSSAIDRALYLDASGHLRFGVQNNTSINTISSPNGYNDGAWHLVDATFDGSTATLYVDGAQVASGQMTDNISFPGYWRVAGDSLAHWPGSQTTGYLAGSLADVAVYPSALTSAQAANHYALVHGGGVTPPPANQPPAAAFTASCTGLSCSFDGTGSSDSDGTIQDYAWSFGDTSTGDGATVSHGYGAPGSYSVTLTVTDNQGATTSVTHPVNPAAAVTSYANDAFNRTVTGGWGTADSGGAWTSTGTAGALSVSPGAGSIAPAVAKSAGAYLSGVSTSTAEVTATVSQSAIPAGTNGAYVYVIGRRVSSTEEYVARLRFDPSGKLFVQLSKYDGSGTEVGLTTEVNVGTYTAGKQFQVRLQVFGTNATTLRVRVWAAGSTEPTTWTSSTMDSSAALQAPGAVGLNEYLSSHVTGAAPVAKVSQFAATSPTQ